MRVPRQAAIAAQYLLDEWLPPRLRDSWVLMRPPMKAVMGGPVTDELKTFKDHAFGMTPAEFAGAYERAAAAAAGVHGETDLNRACTRRILRSVVGETVLEAGCGRGYLAGRLAERYPVTAADIIVDDGTRERHPRVTFREANVEALPFGGRSFDTVICTHTLEHVQDLQQAIRELRRVARRRLIVVVPRQRPYKYTFSHHLHFFPYEWSLLAHFGDRAGVTIERLGDWYYQEDVDTT